MASLKKFIGVMGMSEITVKIKGIKKDVAKNGKPFYRVTFEDGTVAFAWDWNHIRNAKIGKMATLMTEKQGNFLYIKDSNLAEDEEVEEIASEDVDDVRRLPVAEEPDDIKEENLPRTSWPKDETEKSSAKPPKKIQPKDSTDVAIARMSVLKAALEYLNYCAVFTTKGDPLSESEVCEIAQRFEAYVYDGK